MEGHAGMDAPPPAPLPSVPSVAWEPSAPDAGGLTFTGVLRDTFARYGADPIRIFLVGVIPSLLSIVVAGNNGATLLVSLLGALSTAITFVLVDRGPSVPLGQAVRLALGRYVWLVITLILIGLLIFAVAVIPLIFIGATVRSGGSFTLVAVLLVIAVAWIALRLTLALPAVVVDGLNPNPAFSRARAATRGLAVLRFLAIMFVVGIAAFPVGLAAGALSIIDSVPTIVVYLVGGLLAAVVGPLAAIAELSAYRRVFPAPSQSPAPDAGADLDSAATPATPDVAAPPAAADVPPVVEWAPPGVATASSSALTSWPPVAAPAFGRLARAIVGVSLAIAIGGTIAFVMMLGALVTGLLSGQTGVPRGTIAFGASADLATCSVTGEFTELPPGGAMAYLGSFSHRTTATDRIRLVVTYDGIEVLDEAQLSGVFDCLGNPVPESGLAPGRYELTLYVNDLPSATGGFTAR